VPTEGVIDEFFVTPNQTVAEGQALFRLDLTTLTSRLNVAQQEIQIASSEYRQSALQSLTDAKSRTQLSGQEGKAAERQVEVAYLKELLSKAQIKSPRAGVVLFDDPSEWIGKPVVAGEKIMVVTTEGDAEIEAWLPVGDAITLPTDASVTLYLNASPLSPVGGHLRYVGHETIQRPDGSYAYRLRAKLVPGEHAPRVGLRGTAKVSGQYVPLVYWVLRKPLGSIRQLLGI
jgi:multidrug resistance efflux pump